MKRVVLFGAVLALLAPLLGAFPSSANEALWSGSRAAEARKAVLLTAIRDAGEHGLDLDWYAPSGTDQGLSDALVS